MRTKVLAHHRALLGSGQRSPDGSDCVLSNPPRVLLADDHSGILAVLERLLAPSCHIVGQITVGSLVLDATARLNPDVLVMDISMPALNGLDACKQVKDAAPHTKVIILTAAADDAIKDRAYELGASGFVLKHRVAEELVEAIHKAMRRNAQP